MARIIDEIKQIGIVTGDIEATIASFEAFGVGGWTPVRDITPEGYDAMVLDGEPKEYGMRASSTFDLNIELELIQPLDEHSDYARFLKSNGGPGIHHISVDVEDPEEVCEAAEGKILIGGKVKGSPVGWAYFDFREQTGLVTEYFPYMYGEDDL